MLFKNKKIKRKSKNKKSIKQKRNNRKFIRKQNIIKKYKSKKSKRNKNLSRKITKYKLKGGSEAISTENSFNCEVCNKNREGEGKEKIICESHSFDTKNLEKKICIGIINKTQQCKAPVYNNNIFCDSHKCPECKNYKEYHYKICVNHEECVDISCKGTKKSGERYCNKCHVRGIKCDNPDTSDNPFCLNHTCIEDGCLNQKIWNGGSKYFDKCYIHNKSLN